MQVRHVLVDQNHFLLVLAQDSDLLIIEEKISLQLLRTRIDYHDPRKLVVCDSLVLYFDSPTKCTYIRNMLDLNKQQ